MTKITPTPQAAAPAHVPEINSQQFASALGAAAKNVSAFIIALGIIWGATWYAVQPRIDAYFDDKLAAVTKQLAEVSETLRTLETRLPKRKPFIEVKDGIGIINPGPFTAGRSIGFLYKVRRSLPCTTTMKVQFFSATRNGIAGELTYLIPAHEIASSFGFSLQPMYVRLPADMPAGRYSFVPDLIPDNAECPTQSKYSVAPSPFFEVVRGE